jgi:hypothetical protein
MADIIAQNQQRAAEIAARIARGEEVTQGELDFVNRVNDSRGLGGVAGAGNFLGDWLLNTSEDIQELYDDAKEGAAKVVDASKWVFPALAVIACAVVFILWRKGKL